MKIRSIKQLRIWVDLEIIRLESRLKGSINAQERTSLEGSLLTMKKLRNLSK